MNTKTPEQMYKEAGRAMPRTFIAGEFAGYGSQEQAAENDFLMSPYEQAAWLENTAAEIELLHAQIKELSIKAEAYDAMVVLIQDNAPQSLVMGYDEPKADSMRRRAMNILKVQLSEQIAADHAAYEKDMARKAAAKKRAKTLAAKKAEPATAPVAHPAAAPKHLRRRVPPVKLPEPVDPMDTELAEQIAADFAATEAAAEKKRKATARKRAATLAANRREGAEVVAVARADAKPRRRRVPPVALPVPDDAFVDLTAAELQPLA